MTAPAVRRVRRPVVVRNVNQEGIYEGRVTVKQAEGGAPGLPLAATVVLEQDGYTQGADLTAAQATALAWELLALAAAAGRLE